MHSLFNLRLSLKLAVSFIIILILFVATFSFFLIGKHSQRRALDRMAESYTLLAEIRSNAGELYISGLTLPAGTKAMADQEAVKKLTTDIDGCEKKILSHETGLLFQANTPSYNTLKSSFAEFKDSLTGALNTPRKKGADASLPRLRETYEGLTTSLRSLETGLKRSIDEELRAQSLKRGAITAVFFTIVLACLAAVFFLIKITIIERMTLLKTTTAGIVASIMKESSGLGQLSRHTDEIGAIAGNFDTLAEIARGVLFKIQFSGITLASSSKSLSSATEVLFQSSSNELEFVTSIIDGIQEVKDDIIFIFNNSRLQSDNCSRIGGLMNDLTSSIKGILGMVLDIEKNYTSVTSDAREAATTIDDTKGAMRVMQSVTDKIKEIVGFIDDISEQINLLSLNAAIEAARAGDHGRGFAVVSEEISKLAEQTAKSTSEIRRLIENVLKEVHNSVGLVEKMALVLQNIIRNIEVITGKISNFTTIVQDQTNNTTTVADEMQKITTMALEINNSTQKQKDTIEIISRFINAISKVSQQVSKEAGNVSDVSRNVANLAQVVENIIMEFESGH